MADIWWLLSHETNFFSFNLTSFAKWCKHKEENGDQVRAKKQSSTAATSCIVGQHNEEKNIYNFMLLSQYIFFNRLFDNISFGNFLLLGTLHTWLYIYFEIFKDGVTWTLYDCVRTSFQLEQRRFENMAPLWNLTQFFAPPPSFLPTYHKKDLQKLFEIEIVFFVT